MQHLEKHYKPTVDTFSFTVFNEDMSLTTNDIKLIKDVMKITIDEELDVKLDEKLDEKLKFLPTKVEFFEQTDKLMKELKDMREEHILLSHKVYENHEPRIKGVEKKLNISASL